LRNGKKQVLPGLIAAAVLAAAAWALVHLFLVRFSAGTPYPPYSSLRTDPLGTRALYEALRMIPGLRVDRRFSVEAVGENSRSGRDATLVLGLMGGASRGGPLGGMSVSVDPLLCDFLLFARESRLLETAVSGGRIYAAFRADAPFDFRAGPGTHVEDSDDEKDDAPEEAGAEGDDEAGLRDERDAPCRTCRGNNDGEKSGEDEHEDSGCGVRCGVRKNAEFWRLFAGVSMTTRRPPGVLPIGERRYAVRLASEPGLPERLPWYSRAYFTLTEDAREAWSPLYGWDAARPVMIQRRVGNGVLILATDSYLLSNEALARNRQTDFILWLVDGCRRVTFDEMHFGMVEQPTMMQFFRRYRLESLLAVLAVAALLYVWQSLARMIPLPAETPEEEWGAEASGRAAATALTDLVRRHVPPFEALELCVQEYMAASARGRQVPPRKADAVFARLAREKAARNPNPVACYNDIRKILEERTVQHD